MKQLKKLTFEEQLKVLEDKIKNTYEQGVTLEEAERLAAEFLHAQLVVSTELAKKDLDARMKKSGNKAIRAAVYLSIVEGSEKKPTESHISATIETNEQVSSQQDLTDTAEAEVAELERVYNVFGNAHIFYRNVARGKFE